MASAARRLPLVLAIACAAGLMAAPIATAAKPPPRPVLVTTTADKIGARGGCSLREAILSVNSARHVGGCHYDKDSRTIQIPPGTYSLSIPGRQEDAGLTGDLDITTSMQIVGAGQDTTLIGGAGLDRIFDVHGPVAVGLQDLTAQNGWARVFDEGGFYRGEPGGAVNAPLANLTLARTQIQGTTIGQVFGHFSRNLSGPGGAIYVGSGSLSVQSSDISGVGESGGAVFVQSGNADIADSTLTGDVFATGGAIAIAGGRLHLTSSSILAATARDGGAIWNDGEAIVEDTTIDGSLGVAIFSSGFAGAIVNSGTMTLARSTVSHSFGDLVGAIHNRGSLTLTRTTIASNTAAEECCALAGGIYNSGHLVMESSTIAENTGMGGPGGIANAGGTVLVSHSTVYGNHHALGLAKTPFLAGGIEGNATLAGSILAGNDSTFEDDNGFEVTQPLDCEGNVGSDGHNLIQSLDGCSFAATGGDILGSDPDLRPLADNGGETLTLLPASGSPAVDAGPASCPPVDQRGDVRPADGDGDGTPVCDIGAVEVQP